MGEKSLKKHGARSAGSDMLGYGLRYEAYVTLGQIWTQMVS